MSEVCPGCGKKGGFDSMMQGFASEPTYIMCLNDDCDVSEYETNLDYEEFKNITPPIS